jgi:hypothetical protein
VSLTVIQKELAECRKCIDEFVQEKRSARSDLQKLYNQNNAGNSFTFAEMGDSDESGVGTSYTKLFVRVGDTRQEIAADIIAFQEVCPQSSSYVPIITNFRVSLPGS